MQIESSRQRDDKLIARRGVAAISAPRRRSICKRSRGAAAGSVLCRPSPRITPTGLFFVDMSQINRVRVIDSKFIRERGHGATGNDYKSEGHGYERAARGSAVPLAVRHRIDYSFGARGGSVPSAISARSDSPYRTRAALSAYSQHAQARRVAAQLARQRGQARAVGAQRVQAARARQRRQRRQPARVRQDPATRRASAQALAPSRRPATGRESPAGRFRPLPELSSA